MEEAKQRLASEGESFGNLWGIADLEIGFR